LKDKHHILKEARYIPCSQQSNGYECSLFAIGTQIHAFDGIPIDDTIFNQDDITSFCKELYNILSLDLRVHHVNDPMTSLSREYIISFFPILYIEYNDSNNRNIELDSFIQKLCVRIMIYPVQTNHGQKINKTINKLMMTQ
jgi:hypothetical protein